MKEADTLLPPFHEKLGQIRFDGSGDTRQGVHRNSLLAALDFTNVFWVQIGQLAEFFLGKIQPLPVCPDGVAQDCAMAQRFSHATQP